MLKQNIENLLKKIETYKERVENEEMTKTAFIMPFFELLGYDTRNPFEFVPEFTADVAGAKGEKIDYAIFVNDNLEMLIEAKNWREELQKHDKQLNRYFNVSKAKIGILTNGIHYRFFTDLEEINKMDEEPFLEFNLLDLKERHINELKKFTKEKFNKENILNTAEELKYLSLIRCILKAEFENPSDDFVSVLIKNVFNGVKTSKVKEKFQPLIKKAISEIFNEMVKEKLENAFEVKLEDKKNNENVEIIEPVETEKNTVETTQEELDGFNIVKSILSETINIEKIKFKDTHGYFNILLDGNVRKWICRLYFNTGHKYISFPIFEEGVKTKKEGKILLENGVYDIYKHRHRVIKTLELYIN